MIADVLAARGAAALVVRGDDGLDELTTAATSTVWVVAGGAVRVETLDPADLGIARATHDDLRGGDASVNAGVFRELLAGKGGPVRDAVLLNSAAALVAFDGPGPSLVDELRAALPRVAAAIDSGAAERLLARWAEVSTALR